jgi:hypothetical protein
MKTLQSIGGYTWAGICFFIVVTVFVGNHQLVELLAKAPFMKVHPKYSGGEIAATADHGLYFTQIHRPVFDALVGESKKGFVQVNWTLKSEAEEPPFEDFPAMIDEAIDYDQDGRDDFRIVLDTATDEASLEGFRPEVVDLALTVRLHRGWVVRVNLHKP